MGSFKYHIRIIIDFHILLAFHTLMQTMQEYIFQIVDFEYLFSAEL